MSMMSRAILSIVSLVGSLALTFACGESGRPYTGDTSTSTASDSGDDSYDAGLTDASVSDAGFDCLRDCALPMHCSIDRSGCTYQCADCADNLVCPGENGGYYCNFDPNAPECMGHPSNGCGYCQYYDEVPCNAPNTQPSTVELLLMNLMGCEAAFNSECHKSTLLDFDASELRLVFSWNGTTPGDEGTRQVYSGPLPEALRTAWMSSTPQLWCQSTIYGRTISCFIDVLVFRSISAKAPGIANEFGGYETLGMLPAKPIEDAIRATEAFVTPIWADAGIPYTH